MQKQKQINFISILLGIFFLTACEYATIHPDVPSPDVKVSFQTEVVPIFATCNGAGCHNGSGPKPDLRADKAYQSLIDNAMVIPFNGNGSILYQVLLPSGVMAAYGNSTNNAIIKNWIDQGAENN